MIIDDIKKCYYSIECKVPEGGNKCDDCINKEMCLLIIKTYNKIKKNYKKVREWRAIKHMNYTNKLKTKNI